MPKYIEVVEKELKIRGFASFEEFCKLTGNLDLGIEEVCSRYRDWYDRNGDRNSLLEIIEYQKKLIRTQNISS